MPNIFHIFTINATSAAIFNAITTPEGLDVWWTKSSKGNPVVGTTYQLDFGPTYLWEAIVTKSIKDTEFELQITKSDADWLDTKVGFVINHTGRVCQVSFYHKNWHEETENFKFSSYCWAMYLRIMKRNIEHQEIVPYEIRLKV